jgi:hypothetical protein
MRGRVLELQDTYVQHVHKQQVVAFYETGRDNRYGYGFWGGGVLGPTGGPLTCRMNQQKPAFDFVLAWDLWPCLPSGAWYVLSHAKRCSFTQLKDSGGCWRTRRPPLNSQYFFSCEEGRDS